MRKTAFVLLVVSILAFCILGTAYGFQEGTGERWGALGPKVAPTCNDCHGGAGPGIAYGPHGNFSSTTDSCKACHDVHEALSSKKLLPKTTELEICQSCHSFAFTGAGGYGVYGALRARGAFAQSRHNIEGYNTTEALPATQTAGGTKPYTATSTIPGGDASGVLPTNSAGNHNLTCTSCHSPHGNSSVAVFLGERIRTSGVAAFTSNRILQDDLLETPRNSYTTYGSYWCAGCHKNRHDSSYTPSAVNNHPVVIASTTAYGALSQAEGGVTWNTLRVANSDIPTQHLAGYSRNATAGWAPECQQCHEDYRNVEQAFFVNVGNADDPADNPLFQTFPHEGQARRFNVESGDDLCLNCHPTSNLP